MSSTNKISLLAATLYALALGGCSTLEIEPTNYARLSSGKYIHIPLVSMDEDKLLKDATERAIVLHSQLRAFDTANKFMENRIQRLRSEMQSSSKGSRRGAPILLKDSKLILSNRFDVRFAKGSVTLDDQVVNSLSKALTQRSLALQAKQSEQKQLVVLQVATHKKDGLDSLNARRLGAIHELFKKHNVSADTIKLKIVRIPEPSPAVEMKGEGNASRVIQFSSLLFGNNAKI
jgi:hypothetical protein